MSSTTPVDPRAATVPGTIQRTDPSETQRMMNETAMTVARIAASLIVPVLSFIFLPLPIALAITAVVIIANVADCLCRLVPSNEGERRAPILRREVTVVHGTTQPTFVNVLHQYPDGGEASGRSRRDDFASGLASLASSVGLRTWAPSATSRGDLPLSGRHGPQVAVGSGHAPSLRPLHIGEPSLAAPRVAGMRLDTSSHLRVGSGHLPLPPHTSLATTQRPLQPFSPSMAAYRPGQIRPEADPSLAVLREESAGAPSPSPTSARSVENILFSSAADPRGPADGRFNVGVGSRRGTG